MTINECAKLLGEAIAKDEITVRFNAAKAAFEGDAALQEKIAEYNAQRMILGKEFAKDNAMQDAELIATLQARIEELYNEVVNSAAYVEYGYAQERLNALMQSVNSDINFYAFGERPCTHDCSTCSSACSSRE